MDGVFEPDALATALADARASHFSEQFVNIYIPVAALAGLLFALYQVAMVSGIRVHSLLLDDDTEALLGPASDHDDIAKSAAHIHNAIKEGAQSFLKTEYKAIITFCVPFSVVIFLLLGSGDAFTWKWKDDPQGVLHSPKVAVGLFSSLAFILGALTSMVCGYLGMMVGTYGNVRTAVEARRGMAPAFSAAYRSGSVMGFLLSALALLMLFAAVHLYRLYFKDDWASLFAAVAGYGLGGSTVALFGRVGGGVYTKAADVGADLAGKIGQGIPEDDPRNAGVIADLVGDCVGDIAGMGADLFGSYAESSVSALVLASVSSLGTDHQWTALMYPLMISSTSILVCIFTTLIASDLSPARSVRAIQPVLKMQLIISAALSTFAMLPITLWTLPAQFDGIFMFDSARTCRNWNVYVCVVAGIVCALLIGLITEYYTSFAYKPVRDVAEACRTGSGTNIIYGLALGYKSAVLPVLLLAVTVFLALQLASFYGVACAALGMLSTLATCLSIDAFGPISDNAGGIAEMSHMGEDVRERTDALDAAGNTTAAIGKGVAIGSAALVALALFGSYITQAGLQLQDASMLDSKVFSGLLIGALLPYLFSAMTIKAVGLAAQTLALEVRRQFRHIPGLLEGSARPDYDQCISICTRASLQGMVAPGALVLISPVACGILFGTHALAGLLAGSLVSGVQMAISAANSGGAWDNAKKYLEAGATDQARSIGGKGSDAHKAAVVGDTVGDPLKDTSGPSLNILVKLMAVESLVLAPFFAQYTAEGLIFKWLKAA